MSASNPAVDPAQLVSAFAISDRRYENFSQLVARGSAALPALREGLRHENWQIRRWCAICLDHVADADALSDLVPLLRDPHYAVRLWAVHAVACDHCKDGVDCPIDLVPLLIERIETDENLRVRRMATIMLGTEFTDTRAKPVLERLLREETDRRLRLHAANGLERLAAAGI